MSRYIPVAVISSASFLLGVHFSDKMLREGRAESVLVQTMPQLPEVNHKSVSITEFWKEPSRASQIMEFGFPGYDNLKTYSDFIVSYNRQTRNAHWVQEHLMPENMKWDPAIDRSK